jgi:hypothetical protein
MGVFEIERSDLVEHAVSIRAAAARRLPQSGSRSKSKTKRVTTKARRTRSKSHEEKRRK